MAVERGRHLCLPLHERTSDASVRGEDELGPYADSSTDAPSNPVKASTLACMGSRHCSTRGGTHTPTRASGHAHLQELEQVRPAQHIKVHRNLVQQQHLRSAHVARQELGVVWGAALLEEASQIPHMCMCVVAPKPEQE